MIASVLILGENLELMHGTFVSTRKIPGPGRTPEQSRVTSAMSCRHQSGSESQSCLSLSGLSETRTFQQKIPSQEDSYSERKCSFPLRKILVLMLTYPLKRMVSVSHNQGNSFPMYQFLLTGETPTTKTSEAFDLGVILSPFCYSDSSHCLDGEQILV